MPHSTKTLPKWAQQLMERQAYKIEELSTKVRTLEESMAYLTDGKRSWFTLRGPHDPEKRESYTLFILNRDSAHAVCTLNHKDMLIVGRYRK